MDAEQDLIQQYQKTELFKRDLIMKTCHLCQMVVKTVRSITCSNCSKTHCFPCIIKVYGKEGDHLLPQNQKEILQKNKVNECFVCLKQCKCLKCTTEEFVVVQPNNIIQAEEKKAQYLNFEDEPIPEIGIFKGKKISSLPKYLQKAYQFKKMLYSNHQLSKPTNINAPPPEPNKDKGVKAPVKNEKQKIDEPRFGQPLEVEAGQNNQHLPISKEALMDVQIQISIDMPQKQMDVERQENRKGNTFEEKDASEEIENRQNQLQSENQEFGSNENAISSPLEPAPSSQAIEVEDPNIEGEDAPMAPEGKQSKE